MPKEMNCCCVDYLPHLNYRLARYDLLHACTTSRWKSGGGCIVRGVVEDQFCWFASKMAREVVVRAKLLWVFWSILKTALHMYSVLKQSVIFWFFPVFLVEHRSNSHFSLFLFLPLSWVSNCSPSVNLDQTFIIDFTSLWVTTKTIVTRTTLFVSTTLLWKLMKQWSTPTFAGFHVGRLNRKYTWARHWGHLDSLGNHQSAAQITVEKPWGHHKPLLLGSGSQRFSQVLFWGKSIHIAKLSAVKNKFSRCTHKEVQACTCFQAIDHLPEQNGLPPWSTSSFCYNRGNHTLHQSLHQGHQVQSNQSDVVLLGLQLLSYKIAPHQFLPPRLVLVILIL